jgi:dCTP deaminase
VILSDHDIAKLCREGLITPFDDYLLNPASLDVRLGTQLMIETEDSDELQVAELDPASITKNNPFLLRPNEFVLGQTLETFNVPDDICGQFALKSSLARAGFEHLLAGWIDPGFNSSVLTLELKNARQHKAIPLWPGMRIGQIIFMRMSSRPDVSYRDCGRYNGDKQVTGSKGL